MYERKQKYGLTLLCTSDKELKAYITSFLNQLNGWLHRKTVQKVVVCVTDTITGEVCEKWQFNVECDKDQTADSNKTEKQINKEIQAVLRQVCWCCCCCWWCMQCSAYVVKSVSAKCESE